MEPGPAFSVKSGWDAYASDAFPGFANVSGARGTRALGLETESQWPLGLLSLRDASGVAVAAAVWPDIDGVCDIDDKSMLHAALERAGIAASAAPPTASIAWDAEDLRPEDLPAPGAGGLYVLKPAASSRGDGIVFLRGDGALDAVRRHVQQLAELTRELPLHAERVYGAS